MYNLHMCRAKTFDGVWVIGYVVFPSDPLPGCEAIIIPAECNMFDGEAAHKLGFDNWYRVDKDTICSFTGFNDVNGVYIWENDIARCVYDGEEHYYKVCWDSSELGFKATNGEENYGGNFQYLTCCDEIQVVGNVFDDPWPARESRVL